VLSATAFECAGPEDWRLEASVPSKRRRQLLKPPSFARIVASLLHNLAIEDIHWQRAKSGEPAFRVIAKLRATATAVDLFHNSAGGYRAQYMVSIEAGEVANQFALDEILPVVVPHLRRRRPSIASSLEQSLRHPWAKIWIHQGQWLRYARRENRVLRVPAWVAQHID
jgi:hypothetical protein